MSVDRSVPEEIRRALRVRAAEGRENMDAEIREVEIREAGEETVRPAARVRIGAELAAFGQSYGGLEFDCLRDPSPTDAVTFE